MMVQNMPADVIIGIVFWCIIVFVLGFVIGMKSESNK